MTGYDAGGEQVPRRRIDPELLRMAHQSRYVWILLIGLELVDVLDRWLVAGGLARVTSC